MKHTFSPHRLADNPVLLETLKRLAVALARLMGRRFEVAVHDFGDLDASLIYLQGSVTGRKKGASISSSLRDLLTEHGNAIQDRINYRLRVKGGRLIRSTTTFIRDDNDLLMGCFCCNYDVSELLNMRDLLNEFAHLEDPQQKAAPGMDELSSSEYIDKYIEQAASSLGRQLPFLERAERLEFIRMLDRNGIFKLKGAVNHVADRLGVSRYSIYNYINEVKAT